jgi:hypothetical protein
MALEAIALNAFNIPGDYFSLADFEVNVYSRFWVTPEGYSMRGKKGP